MGNNNSKRGKTFKYLTAEETKTSTHRHGQRVYFEPGAKLVVPSVPKSEDFRGLVRDILQEEYILRGTVQFDDSLKKRALARKKEAELDSHAGKCEEQSDAGLKETTLKLMQNRIRLYVAENALPPQLKQLYDNLRRNPKWYMRQGMVEDCSAQGGCCSRGCGCCEKRSFSSEKGQGHCTIGCWCCSVYRGYYPTPDDFLKLETELSRVSERLEYLERMGNWFFDPLIRGELGKSE